MRILRAKIRNFRAIEYASVPFHPQLTVLIGDNASAKTTILDAVVVSMSPIIEGIGKSRRSSVQPDDFRVLPKSDIFGFDDRPRSDEVVISVDTDQGELGGSFTRELTSKDRFEVLPSLNTGLYRSLRHMYADGVDQVLPIIAYYRESRAINERDRDRDLFQSGYQRVRSRRSALIGALSGRSVYSELIRWFEETENFELRQQRELGEDHRDPRLEAVRSAVSKMIPGVSNLRMVGHPPKLMMDISLPDTVPGTLTLDQLSSGYRVMLALVMDLARRMADLNPDLPNPLETPGVVLIDEIDLHLHPRWQQLVVPSLLSTFPAVQFVISTHSPQVLTTINEDNIIRLRWRGSILDLESVSSPNGSESGRMLTEAMDVEERPPASVSEFVLMLENYLTLVRQGRWNTPEAADALQRMQELSPHDPVHNTIELERKRLSVAQRRSQS